MACTHVGELHPSSWIQYYIVKVYLSTERDLSLTELLNDSLNVSIADVQDVKQYMVLSGDPMLGVGDEATLAFHSSLFIQPGSTVFVGVLAEVGSKESPEWRGDSLKNNPYTTTVLHPSP